MQVVDKGFHFCVSKAAEGQVSLDVQPRWTARLWGEIDDFH